MIDRDRIELRLQRIGWLRALVATFSEEHSWAEDEDPAATGECLRECRALAAELEAELPALEPLEAMPDDPTIPF